MSFRTAGIHHVTGIASDPQRNLDFYAGVLGLRLVKRTVNFDDPTTYHFYFGDEQGNPGTILTFFPWPDARRGRQGGGQVAVTSFAILPSSVGFWIERLITKQVEFSQPVARYEGERVIAFKDHDGFMGELVAHQAADARTGWSGAGIPPEHAIRCIYSVTLWLDANELTGQLLTTNLGFKLVREQGSIFRYAAGDGGPGSIVDLRCVPGIWSGAMGAGTVHHVAFRASDEAEQMSLRTELTSLGYNVTPQLDRDYFKSIYFREPGGVLFEVATDGPGFAVDEPVEALGHSLKLPDWLEPRRFEIEALLPNIHTPLELRGPNA
ncbi:MAG: glyoxalase family protein [Gemmatimonadaceae bacterium]|jgi:catechol 2,3-dioxygenase-like lactoylglutathione lyase family enzyme|nr:glyoxalase family protein [Gemmatimonadaceae bacterium]